MGSPPGPPCVYHRPMEPLTEPPLTESSARSMFVLDSALGVARVSLPALDDIEDFAERAAVAGRVIKGYNDLIEDLGQIRRVALITMHLGGMSTRDIAERVGLSPRRVNEILGLFARSKEPPVEDVVP